MMSLVTEQAEFLLHVGELLRKAVESGFTVTGGELYRTPEQQALYLRDGRSKTMNSQHLRRLAIDLNFFQEEADGSLKLVYDTNVLRPLGDFWEGLDPANRWGGNWSNFKDIPHFERQSGTRQPTAGTSPAASPPTADTPPIPVTAPAVATRGIGLLAGAVGQHCANNRDDVETVQRLLNLRSSASDTPLKPDGAFGEKTHAAICAFQREALGLMEPEGKIDPRDRTLAALCQSLPGGIDEPLLALLYLRASDADIHDFAAPIRDTMVKRAIDTARRQAHFLAQIGHESGELRWREELASGKAYEGRRDLGNTQPGDGPRFKGRGLIQLTGRANYEAYGKAISRKEELLGDPKMVAEDRQLCVDAAGWFWEKNKLNDRADRDDLVAVTKRINGGTNGLEDRRRLLLRAKALLGA